MSEALGAARFARARLERRPVSQRRVLILPCACSCVMSASRASRLELLDQLDLVVEQAFDLYGTQADYSDVTQASARSLLSPSIADYMQWMDFILASYNAEAARSAKQLALLVAAAKAGSLAGFSAESWDKSAIDSEKCRFSCAVCARLLVNCSLSDRCSARDLRRLERQTSGVSECADRARGRSSGAKAGLWKTLSRSTTRVALSCSRDLVMQSLAIALRFSSLSMPGFDTAEAVVDCSSVHSGMQIKSASTR